MPTIKKISGYLRSAVAAQVNNKIDFKSKRKCKLTFEELNKGIVDRKIFEELIEGIKKTKDKEDDKKAGKLLKIDVIIVAKIIKTIFEGQERKEQSLENLTGIYFIPANLDVEGNLSYSEGKLPWIPREFLQPMVEESLSIGNSDKLDKALSESVSKVNEIQNWEDYLNISKKLYKDATDCDFESEKICGMDLENSAYIFFDDTINATFAILSLYDDLISKNNNDKKILLYENLLNLNFNKTNELLKNNIAQMENHCGQMGGDYPLSCSQRECINHFNEMKNGEILAVNGPPGTGKTTLLQSIVANLYVKRAIEKEKPPIIVATSTNNQAVTNIIESFGQIKKIGYKNLENRWIEEVNSFAVYFTSSQDKWTESKEKGYHYTSSKGDNFIENIEKNIEFSKGKIIDNCNEFFNINFKDIEACKDKIHETLCDIDNIRKELLSIVNEFEIIGYKGKSVENDLKNVESKINSLQGEKEEIDVSIKALNKRLSRRSILSWILRIFKCNVNEGDAIEYKCLLIKQQELKEKLDSECKKREILMKLQALNNRYQENIKNLKNFSIDISNIEMNKNTIKEFNELLDKNIRYLEFWLAVHYYECRWANNEDPLTNDQKKTTYANVLEKRYNRLSMLTPCFVMTFYQLPKYFRSYEKKYLYEYIDLLIVDEAGQVSPEIAVKLSILLDTFFSNFQFQLIST